MVKQFTLEGLPKVTYVLVLRTPVLIVLPMVARDNPAIFVLPLST
jgi:hypothetical protein